MHILLILNSLKHFLIIFLIIKQRQYQILFYAFKRLNVFIFYLILKISLKEYSKIFIKKWSKKLTTKRTYIWKVGLVPTIILRLIPLFSIWRTLVGQAFGTLQTHRSQQKHWFDWLGLTNLWFAFPKDWYTNLHQ